DVLPAGAAGRQELFLKLMLEIVQEDLRQAVSPGARRGAEPRDQARGVPATVTFGLYVGVELIDQRGQRRRGAAFSRRVERDAQILAHPVDREAEVEPAFDHRLPAVLH